MKGPKAMQALKFMLRVGVEPLKRPESSASINIEMPLPAARASVASTSLLWPTLSWQNSSSIPASLAAFYGPRAVAAYTGAVKPKPHQNRTRPTWHGMQLVSHLPPPTTYHLPLPASTPPASVHLWHIARTRPDSFGPVGWAANFCLQMKIYKLVALNVTSSLLLLLSVASKIGVILLPFSLLAQPVTSQFN